MSYLDMPLGEIATQLPGATSILFSHKINFCCNGDKTLKEVIEKKNLNPDDIVPYLEAMANRNGASEDWSKVDNKSLIEHILTRYHQVHREQLPELIRLAARVETVHGSHELCPNGLADLMSGIKQELEQHMHKEESILFPMLSGDNASMALGPINVMMADHEHHIQDIEKIYQLSNDLSLHQGACNTWRALYLGLQEFITDINMHIHIENNILFSRVLNKDMATGNGPAVGIMSESDIKKTESEEFCCGSCS
jgi:regulator of cell morphogenesis and NO signaling